MYNTVVNDNFFENPDEIEINNLESLDDMPLIINRVKSPFKDDKCLSGD